MKPKLFFQSLDRTNPIGSVLGRDGLWSTAVDCQGATKIVHIVRVTFLLLGCSGVVVLLLFSSVVVGWCW